MTNKMIDEIDRPIFVRIRFEHYYNDILTFDIDRKDCKLECRYCFARSEHRGTSEVEPKSIPLSALKITDNIEKGVLINDEIIKVEDAKCFDNKFTDNDENNNLLKKEGYGRFNFDSESISITIKSIQELLDKRSKNNIKKFRISGGEIFLKKKDRNPEKSREGKNDEFLFLNWYKDFIIKFMKETDLKLIIETNGVNYTRPNENIDISKDIKPPEKINEIWELLDIISKDPDFKSRIHFRISLKNPYPPCYQALTKKGNEDDLKNAITLGIDCLKKEISFHYTIMANYIMMEDLYYFKRKLREEFELKPDEIETIINEIEFERLFYYDCVFKEVLIASYLINNIPVKKIKEKLNEIILNGAIEKFIGEYKDTKKLFNEYNDETKAYIRFFIQRTLPYYKEELYDTQKSKDYNHFFHSQVEAFKKLYTIEGNIKENWPESKKSRFKGYKGLQKFWQSAFNNISLIQPYEREILFKEIEFEDICIIDRIPLFPGIFYLQDFWRLNNPAFFSYALYADSSYIKLNKKEKTYMFSLNKNPDSYAHTDVSRAVPIVVRDQVIVEKLSNNKTKNKSVLHFKSLKTKLFHISKIVLQYGQIRILIPLFVLELVEYELMETNNENYPFLGNLGALYENKKIKFLDLKDEKNADYIYLSYFYWTGINDESRNQSIGKLLNYLDRFSILMDDKEDPHTFESGILEMKFLEVRPELYDMIKDDLKRTESLKNILTDEELFKKVSKDIQKNYPILLDKFEKTIKKSKN